MFRFEYFRRTENKKNTEKPRKKYENNWNDKDNEKKDNNEDFIDWILNSNHHQGYEERIAELKKKLEEEKSENNKRKAELNAKKYEMTLEYEKLNKELRQLRGYSPNPEPKMQEIDPYYPADKNCVII